MKNFISIYKPIGMTPLEVIEKLKISYKQLSDKKITYAGRLDPLAHGVLLLLIEDEIKKKAEYLSLTKTYEFEIVFGISTDTYDLLGYLNDIKIKKTAKNVKLFVNKFVNNSIGKHLQEYPPYSSKTVKGKPLFWWAKNNKLTEIIIPKHTIEIFDFSVLSIGNISLQKLEKKITSEVVLVNGDFRQKIILKRWQEFFSQIDSQQKFTTARFRISCSSGTYIRSLAEQIGKEIGSGAIAIDILRTNVGEHSLEDAHILELSNLNAVSIRKTYSTRIRSSSVSTINY
jgi:tRNA pseudouridine55 synthase